MGRAQGIKLAELADKAQRFDTVLGPLRGRPGRKEARVLAPPRIAVADDHLYISDKAEEWERQDEDLFFVPPVDWIVEVKTEIDPGLTTLGRKAWAEHTRNISHPIQGVVIETKNERVLGAASGQRFLGFHGSGYVKIAITNQQGTSRDFWLRASSLHLLPAPSSSLVYKTIWDDIPQPLADNQLVYDLDSAADMPMDVLSRFILEDNEAEQNLQNDIRQADKIESLILAYRPEVNTKSAVHYVRQKDSGKVMRVVESDGFIQLELDVRQRSYTYLIKASEYLEKTVDWDAEVGLQEQAKKPPVKYNAQMTGKAGKGYNQKTGKGYNP